MGHTMDAGRWMRRVHFLSSLFSVAAISANVDEAHERGKKLSEKRKITSRE